MLFLTLSPPRPTPPVPAQPPCDATPGPGALRRLIAGTGLPGDGLFWLAIGLSAASVLAGASLAPGLVGIARALGAEGALWPSLLVSLPALGVPLGAVLFTRFGGLLSERSLLLAMLAVYALGGAGGALIGVPGPMLALRFAQGVAIAPMMLIAMRWLARQADPRGALALQSALMTGSTVFVLIAAGAMAGGDWRAPFALNLLPLALIPAVLRLAGSARSQPAAVPAPTPGTAPAATYLTGLILAFLAMASFFAIPTQIAGALARSGIGGAQPAAQLAAFIIITSVVSAALAGLALRRIGQSRSAGATLLAAFAMMTLGSWQLALGGTLWVAISGAALVGAGFGTIFPTLNHWAIAGSGRMPPGRAMAGITAAFNIGQFAAPLLGAAALHGGHGFEIFFPYLVLAGFGLTLVGLEARRIDAALHPAEKTTPTAQTPTGDRVSIAA